MNINGKWTGTIIYGKEYRVHQNKEVYFDLDINQDAEKIKGTAIDIGGFGNCTSEVSETAKVCTDEQKLDMRLVE